MHKIVLRIPTLLALVALTCGNPQAARLAAHKKIAVIDVDVKIIAKQSVFSLMENEIKKSISPDTEEGKEKS